MKLNNKGITLIEIIISIVLVSIVLIFLFTLLISVKDMNTESEVNSTYLINKSLILKNIEEDLKNSSKVTITKCTDEASATNVDIIKSFYTNYKLPDALENQAVECLKFIYNNDDTNYAHLAIYYYENKSNYVISYIHGNTKTTRLLPEFDKNNVVTDTGNIKNDMFINIANVDDSVKYSVKWNDSKTDLNNTNKRLLKITIPIIGDDEKDYTILISYYGIVDIGL